MLKKQRQRRRASITSLIDVIFLLLLFFMLASTFKRFAELEVSAATPSAGFPSDSDQASVQLLIEPLTLVVNSETVHEESLHAALNAQRADGTLPVSIHVSDTVSTQRLVDILTRLSKINDISLQLVGD